LLRLLLSGWLFCGGCLAGGLVRGGDDARVAVRVMDLLKLRQLIVHAVSQPLKVDLNPLLEDAGSVGQEAVDRSKRLNTADRADRLAQVVSIRVEASGLLLVCLDQVAEPAVRCLRITPGAGEETCRVMAGGIPDREYRGSLDITAEGGILRVVNRLPLADYLVGVIGSEGGGDAPLEALKAQAVLARTFAMRHGGRHGAADFCDTTHCQLYQGRSAVSPVAEAAVRATAGQILTWQGAPARVFYHACCGGVTNSFETAWGRPGPPYLTGIDDGDACAESPQARWEYRLDRAAWTKLLRKLGGGNPVAIRLEETGPGGWVRWLAVEQADGSSVRLRGEEFHIRAGRLLGWNAIRSACFTVRQEGECWVFAGRGFGHGVGLCQAGAAALARRGWEYARILARYFPGTRLEVR
jgi:stage II sporulation protein D